MNQKVSRRISGWETFSILPIKLSPVKVGGAGLEPTTPLSNREVTYPITAQKPVVIFGKSFRRTGGKVTFSALPTELPDRDSGRGWTRTNGLSLDRRSIHSFYYRNDFVVLMNRVSTENS